MKRIKNKLRYIFGACLALMVKNVTAVSADIMFDRQDQIMYGVEPLSPKEITGRIIFSPIFFIIILVLGTIVGSFVFIKRKKNKSKKLNNPNNAQKNNQTR